MTKHYSPEYQAKQFSCAYCGVFASQRWGRLFYFEDNYYSSIDEVEFCACAHCNNWSYWHRGRMVIPSEASVAKPHPDMPAACRTDYDEARDVVARSPRSSAALLRLALQKLMPLLKEKGKNINEDIGSLVKKGLPTEIQQALDYCRVVGNNAVHPGELNLDDTPEIARNLFTLMNFIVEDRISRPKKIAAMYQNLPESARKAIEKRDGQ